MPAAVEAGVDAATPERAHLEQAHSDEHALPHETLVPIALAAGIALLGFGLLTSLVFSIVGIAIMGWSLVAWIEEMRHG